MGATIKIAILAQAAKAKAELKSLGDSAEKAGDRVKSGLSDLAGKAKLGAAGAGLAAGAALVAGIGQALEQSKLNSKLRAQLDLSKADAAALGKTAGQVYAAGFGSDLGQVNEAIKGVYQNIGKLAEPALKDVTQKVLTVANAFDQDLSEATAAVGTLMKTGLAKNATEALDIVTKGLQSGADKGGDFLDTITEYSVQFQAMGLDGKKALGLINQGLKAGARNADFLQDALKEFNIRAKDGSKTTSTAFRQLGLDAKKLANDIAAGGPRAAAALDLTLDRLRAVKDPVKQSAIAVGLFGTKSEDLQKALLALDPSSAVASLGSIEGAAKRAGDALADSAGAKVDKLKRALTVGFTEAIGGAIGSLEDLKNKIPASSWAQIADGAKGVTTALGEQETAFKDLWAAVSGGMSGQETLMQTLRVVRGGFDSLTIQIDLVTGAVYGWQAALYGALSVYRLLTGDFSGASEAWGQAEAATRRMGEATGRAAGGVSTLRDNWQQGGRDIEAANAKAAAAAELAAKTTGDAHDRMGSGAAQAAARMSSSHATGAAQSAAHWDGARGQIVSKFNSNTLYSPGQQTASGFAAGIRSAWSAVTATVSSLVARIPAAVRKMLGIASPSKVFKKIGHQTAQGLAAGLENARSLVKAATDKLGEVVRLRDDYAKQLASSVSGQGLAGIVDLTLSKIGARTITDQLTARLQAVRDFHAGIEQLRKKGFGEAVVKSVTDAGLEKGLELIGQLRGASAADVRTIRALDSQITSAAAALGQSQARVQFQSQVNSATAGVTPTVVLKLDSSGSKLDDALIEVLRKAIRRGGGNVQAVLGRA